MIRGYERVQAAGRLASSQTGEARRVIIRARRILTRTMWDVGRGAQERLVGVAAGRTTSVQAAALLGASSPCD